MPFKESGRWSSGSKFLSFSFKRKDQNLEFIICQVTFLQVSDLGYLSKDIQWTYYVSTKKLVYFPLLIFLDDLILS